MNPLRRQKWLVVALLCFSGCVNYMDRNAVSAVFPLLRVEFGMSDMLLGALGTVFLWSYSLSSPLAGWCGDRFPRKLMILLSLGIFSLVTFSTGLMTTVAGLLALRVLLGVSEALYMPAAVSYISDWHSEKTRGLAVGFHQASLSVGGVAGATLAGVIGEAHGWRPSFWLLGGIGLLLAAVFSIALKNIPKGASDNAATATTAAAAAPAPRMSVAETIRLILRTPTALCLIANSFVVSMVSWIVAVWMPSMLHEKFNLSLGSAAFNGTIWPAVAGLAAMLLAGLLADLWKRRNPRARVLVQACGLALLVPAMLCIGAATSLAPMAAGLVLYGIGQATWNSANMPVLCEVTPPSARSTAYGLVNFTGTFGGGVSVLLFARVARAAGTGTVFAALAALMLVALALSLLVAARFHARDTLKT
ncbi:MAG: MFS transporter [Opitutaceae bacterium]|jgi:sugar phosphate permease|nr:MFS transporter [Opitutaceae bacterium]